MFSGISPISAKSEYNQITSMLHVMPSGALIWKLIVLYCIVFYSIWHFMWLKKANVKVIFQQGRGVSEVGHALHIISLSDPNFGGCKPILVM